MHVTVDARMMAASGIGRVIRNLLARIIPQRPDWRFTLIGARDRLLAYPFGQLAHVEVVDCDCQIYSIREQLLLPHLIPGDTDVFWSPHYNIPVFYRGNMVVTVHDVAHLALPEINKGLLKRAYANIMFRSVARKADQIVCVSQFTIDEFTRFVPWLNREKVHLVYNGIDDSWYHIPQGERLYARPYLLYVGNIKPHKNLPFLIRAFQRVADQVPYNLLLVGRKDGFLTGENNVSELIQGWNQRIYFTGWVTDEQLQQYVAQSEAMVFPSLYEGFGLPPLEAMAAGKQVLVSDIPVMREVCGEYAWYFNPHDEQALADRMLSISQQQHLVDSRSVSHHAKMFTWGGQRTRWCA